jgi:hypothetical protein
MYARKMPSEISKIDSDGNRVSHEVLMPGKGYLLDNVIDESGGGKTAIIHCLKDDEETKISFADLIKAPDEDVVEELAIISHTHFIEHESILEIPYRDKTLGRMTLRAGHMYLFSVN